MDCDILCDLFLFLLFDLLVFFFDQGDLVRKQVCHNVAFDSNAVNPTCTEIEILLSLNVIVIIIFLRCFPIADPLYLLPPEKSVSAWFVLPESFWQLVDQVHKHGS